MAAKIFGKWLPQCRYVGCHGIHRCIYAAYEERCHRGGPRYVAARGRQVFKSADVGVHHLAIRVEREDDEI